MIFLVLEIFNQNKGGLSHHVELINEGLIVGVNSDYYVGLVGIPWVTEKGHISPKWCLKNLWVTCWQTTDHEIFITV